MHEEPREEHDEEAEDIVLNVHDSVLDGESHLEGDD